MSALRGSRSKCCCSTRHKSEQARAMCWNSLVTAFCLCDVGALELQPYARRRGLALTHPLRLRAANAKAEPRLHSIRLSQATRRESPATFRGRRPTRTDLKGCAVHLLGRGRGIQSQTRPVVIAVFSDRRRTAQHLRLDVCAITGPGLTTRAGRPGCRGPAATRRPPLS